MGRVDWSLTGAYNDTKVTHIDPSPPQIAPQVLYSATAISILEDASPKFRIIGDAVWTIGRFTVNLRETLYGPSSEEILGDDGVLYDTKIDTTGITDLEVSYKTNIGVRITLGANNLFNQYPNQYNSGLTQSYIKADDNAAVGKYPTFSPFGINGGYYYGKLTYTF
jgi:iron complex outermembrane receptor protein